MGPWIYIRQHIKNMGIEELFDIQQQGLGRLKSHGV